MRQVTRVFIATLPILLFSCEAFARAGGGHGGHCGWMCIILYPFLLLYGLYQSFRINRKQGKISDLLRTMAQTEPQWAEDNLHKISYNKFMEIQAAWGQQDLGVLEKLLSPVLYKTWETDLKAQMARNERNVMSGLSVAKIRIVDVQNYKDDNQDEFTVAIDASANDETIVNGTVQKTDNSKFREFWTFQWHQSEWLLCQVTQQNGWKRFVNAHAVYEK